MGKRLFYSIAVGGATPWLSITIVGFWAAQPVPVDHDWITYYSALVSGLPTILLSAASALLLVALGIRSASSFLVAYAVAVCSFLVLMDPWEYWPGFIEGFIAYWEQYLYLLPIPVLGTILINKKLHPSADAPDE